MKKKKNEKQEEKIWKQKRRKTKDDVENNLWKLFYSVCQLAAN